MTDQLFNALKAIETLASGMMKVYGLPSGQGLDCWNDMARAAGEGHIIPAVQALALGQSMNLHSALSWGYYCLNSPGAGAIQPPAGQSFDVNRNFLSLR